MLFGRSMQSNETIYLINQPSKRTTRTSYLHAIWHPKLSQLPNIIKKHHHLLEEDRELKNIFKDTPIVAFRRARTIRNEVVRSDVSPSIQDTKKKGTSPCGQKGCKTCHLINEEDTLVNRATGKSIKITSGGDCRTSDTVYAARCKVCQFVYVGETSEELRSRLRRKEQT